MQFCTFTYEFGNGYGICSFCLPLSLPLYFHMKLPVQASKKDVDAP